MFEKHLIEEKNMKLSDNWNIPTDNDNYKNSEDFLLRNTYLNSQINLEMGHSDKKKKD